MEGSMSESNTYVTRRGVAIKLCLFSPVLRDKVRQSVEYPEPPMYEAKTAGGGVEKHIYTEDMLETDEEREMWRQYQGRRLAADLQLYDRLGKLALIRGTGIDIPEGWEQEQLLFGIEVPEDPLERKLHWIETEAVESNNDLRDLILAVLQYQNTTEEERAIAAASFPDSMERDTSQGVASEPGAVEGE